jgi:hypothetical protein
MDLEVDCIRLADDELEDEDAGWSGSGPVAMGGDLYCLTVFSWLGKLPLF